MRILFPLLLGQAARIVRFDIDAVKDQAQLADVIDAHAEFGVSQVFTRAAVVAVAAGDETGRGDGIVHVACLSPVSHRTGGLQAVAPATVAAVVTAGFYSRRLLASFGGDVNYAARGVAVQGREGTPQHLYALDAIEIDIGGLALAVRHGCRDPIDIHANAAHAVGRAGAEAAHRELEILSVVLTVLDLQPRHAGQRLGEVNARGGMTHLFPVDHADGGRRIQFGHGLRRGADDQGLLIGGKSIAASDW